MSDADILEWLQHTEQELYSFIDRSLKQRMKGEFDITNYFKDFWSLAGPLLYVSEIDRVP